MDRSEGMSLPGDVHATTPHGAAPSPTNSTLSSSSVIIGGAGSIDKLDGPSNYTTWKFAVRMALILDGLWDQVEGSTAYDAARDQRALARICLSIKSNLYQYVRDAKTSKEAWCKLNVVFENKGLYRRVLLLRQLHSLQYSAFNDMNGYITGILTLVQQLADIGKVIEDDEVAELLLSGLPEEYDSLVSALETACVASSFNSELVRSRLLQEAHRKSETNSGNTAFVAKKSPVICHHCNRPGHVQSKCFKLKREKKKKVNSESTKATAFIASSASDEFYIDSCSSNHLCKSKELMVNIRDSKCKHSITVANNEKLVSDTQGEVYIQSGNVVRQLKNVLFVPELSTNLISVSQLVKDGLTVTFNRSGCNVFDSNCKVTGSCIAQGSCVNGIYKFNGFVCGSSWVSQNKVHSLLLQRGQKSLSAAVAASEPLLEVWHRRLGHLSLSGMCMLQNMANGFDLQKQDTQDLKNCIACLEGKLSAEPFPKNQAKRASKPLELVHTDVCGPMQEASWGGAKYLVTFTDDFTRKTFGFLIKNKSQVMFCFINFQKFVEKQLDFRIKCLRSDNGGEYCSKQFSDYLKSHGIVHQTSVPYTPAQNGVAERLNRTLIEKARSMLQQANLCKRFWGEAVMTAIYLKNRSPTVALTGCTPEEAWTGSKVDLSHLRVFGCAAYSLIPEQKRQKLDAKAKSYIFVGYSDTSKGYRLADPSDPRKVILSRNVTFIENMFYNQVAERANNDFNSDVIPYVLNSNDIESYSNDNNIILNDSQNYNNDNNNVINVSAPDSNISGIVVSDDEYCTGSDTSQAEQSTDESGEEPVMSSDEASDGDVVTSPVAVTSASGRPVRSTRNIIPKRYDSYDLSSLLVQEGPLHYDEPLTYDEAMVSPNKDKWLDAMNSEYQALVVNRVWELVDRPHNENVIKCKWVFKVKHDASGNFDKYKARLVARGFSQKEGIDFNETFAPVVRHSTMRILFSLANQLDLDMEHLDVATAFLNGDINEVIYMEQPKGFCDNSNKVCLLKKSLYGLKQSSRMWNCRIHDFLCKQGFVQSKCEPCVYIKNCNSDMVILALYVDDFYIFCSPSSKNKKDLVCNLEKEFNIKKLGVLKSCLGISVTRDKTRGIVKLNQSQYISKLLERFGMTNCKSVSTPMPVNTKLEKSNDVDNCLQDEVYQYRQLIGSLMYLAVCTRPDISFACSQLSQFNNCFDKSHWLAAKRILRYLAGTIDYSLYFIKSNNWKLFAYADADWGNDITDRKSYTGFVIKLGNDTINWESRKQKCVALSSTESEYLAIADVCKDISFVKNLLSEIMPKTIDCIVFNDNQSAQKLLEAKEYCHKRTKHIDIRYHFVKDFIRENVISVKYLPTEKMIADILTKPLGSNKHSCFVKQMNVM